MIARREGGKKHKESKRGKETNFQGWELESGKGGGEGRKGVMTWIAAKEAKRRWGCQKRRGMKVCEREIERERVLRYTSRLSSGWLCNVHNTGERGGSNAWGAYITKSDTRVQHEMMSREEKKQKTGKTSLKYEENRHSLGMEGENEYIGGTHHL